MSGLARGGAGARQLAHATASSLAAQRRSHSLAHCMAASCLRFCRVKDLCDACVSVFLLEVYTIFENVCLPLYHINYIIVELENPSRAITGHAAISVLHPGWAATSGSVLLLIQAGPGRFLF